MGSTTKTGYYSKDTPPAIVNAPPRQMTSGLAPWLRQATEGTRIGPQRFLGDPGHAPSNQPWWAGQATQANEQRQALVAQAAQARLIRQQEAEAAKAAADAAAEDPITAMYGREYLESIGYYDRPARRVSYNDNADGDGGDGGGDGGDGGGGGDE